MRSSSENLGERSGCNPSGECGVVWLYLIERVWLDLGEFMLHIIGVHRTDLFPRRRAEDFDDLDQLVDS